jgi:hypothetical protein
MDFFYVLTKLGKGPPDPISNELLLPPLHQLLSNPVPLVDERLSDTLKESSSAVPSHAPAMSPSRDEGMSILPPLPDDIAALSTPENMYCPRSYSSKSPAFH